LVQIIGLLCAIEMSGAHKALRTMDEAIAFMLPRWTAFQGTCSLPHSFNSAWTAAIGIILFVLGAGLEHRLSDSDTNSPKQAGSVPCFKAPCLRIAPAPFAH
jgi:hypothetical protein